MRLTAFSDYSLRTLMYLGLRRGRIATIPDVAAAYGISENHLMKVARHLVAAGYVESVRGKGGGLRLARPPEAIGIGEVIRTTEETLALAECFDPDHSRCPIAGTCALRQVLGRALNAFLTVLDEYTLSDLLRPRGALGRILFTERARLDTGRRRVA